MKQVRIP